LASSASLPGARPAPSQRRTSSSDDPAWSEMTIRTARARLADLRDADCAPAP
jgi:hypothetical protein